MNNKKLFFVLITFLFIAHFCGADDTFLGGFGSTVFPLQSKDIVLKSQKVLITLPDLSEPPETHFGYYWVNYDLSFVFYNQGKSQWVLMGFPEGEYDEDTGGDGRLFDFKVEVNGKELKTEKKEGLYPNYNLEIDTVEGKRSFPFSFPTWFTWKVYFKSGERKEIKNTFKCKTSCVSGGIDKYEVIYILRTGTTWKGPIGSATIIVQPINYIFDAQPRNFKKENNTLIWEFKNFEPEFDIKIELTKNKEYLINK
jgi:hypothetical protein